jgi:hypothetical protein
MNKIRSVIKKYKQPFIAWTVIYTMLLAVAVIFVKLYATYNIWLVLSFAILYAAIYRLSNSISQLNQSMLIKVGMLSTSCQILAESVSIQSRRINEVQEFISKLVRPAAKLPIH